MLILVNNRFQKDAKFSITGSLGRGYGIFETMRTFNKSLHQEKEHLDRLFDSAKKIGLKIRYKKTDISKMLTKITQKSKFKDQRVKIIALPEALIITSVQLKIDPKIYEKGVSLKTITRTRGLPEIKSISYLPSYLSNEEAKKKGFFEALLINEEQEIFECAYHNIFWIENGQISTKKGEVLPGTIAKLIDKNPQYKIQYKTIKLPQLLKKKEVFITNSINLIVPVTKIDNKKIGQGKPGPISKELLQIITKLQS